MLASKPAPSAAAAPPPTSDSAPSRLPVAAALAAIACVLTWVYAGNPRLWGSWHGFLHTAIATRFSNAAFPPENPFFAGEPLPYYWAYHFTGYWVARLCHLDLLHAFHAISWIGLAAFVLSAVRIGRMCFRSTAAGLAIAWLGIAGLNPMGPVIAASKHWSRGIPITRQRPTVVETTFVSNQTADDLMTEPLLGAMYLGGDWRQGQNLVWFFDIGSRAVSLAGLMLLLCLLLRTNVGSGQLLAITAVSAFTTAMNPLVGLAAVGALAGACVLTARAARPFLLCAACALGAMLAAPTYLQMFFRSGGSGIAFHPGFALPAAIVIANFLVLGPLAAAGVRAGRYTGGIGLAALAVAGAALLLLVIVIHLPEGNEHNLSNAAACLLAVPAAALIPSRARAGWLILLFLPVTAAALFSFANRPAMPIAISGTTLRRLPANSDLDRLYDWMRRETPPESVFVVDTASPVKMSGNVSELPAFTSRTLFTDAPSYLTTPNRDAALRERLARAATHGEPLRPEERRYFSELRRPVYIVTFAAGETPLIERFAQQYGAPAFRRGFVAVFRLNP